jgi:hypothetical protein
MMNFFMRCTGGLVIAACAGGVRAEECSKQLSALAQEALSGFEVSADTAAGASNWTRFHDLVTSYRACDDGSFAEMFSELTIKMLRAQWDAGLNFTPLTTEGTLRGFVEKHIDATLRSEDLKVVRANAMHKCDPHHRSFCGRIRKLCDEALKEQDALLRAK